MKKKEFKVGEVFQCGLIKLKVEKASKDCLCNRCFGCVFFNRSCSGSMLLTGSCVAEWREDKTDVIFVEVEE